MKKQSGNFLMRAHLFLIPAIILFLTFTGCGTVDFYTQAIHGQYNILVNRQPISEILDNPDTPVDLKNKLQSALDIRTFAIETLKLPGREHYLTYVDVKQPYVAWAVFAAPEFSMKPKTWCYPVVGCAVYRGYFSKEDADTYADRLKEDGYDVYVGGIKAYSTLGWFDDPVLSTFIDKGKIRLASLIFHELAHHIFYVKDDSTFNESFAQTVELEGMRRWFMNENEPGSYKKYLDARKRHKQFIRLIEKYRQALEKMYETKIPDTDKKREKDRLFNQLNAEYQSLKKDWGGFSGYDEWFKKDLNNAKIITVAAYNDLVPAFQNILNAEGGDLELFYKKCKDLSEKSKTERKSFLDQYSGK